jgi:hypothetical protein
MTKGAPGGQEGAGRVANYYRLQVGPTQVGTTPSLVFRAVIGVDGEVDLNLAL